MLVILGIVNPGRSPVSVGGDRVYCESYRKKRMPLHLLGQEFRVVHQIKEKLLKKK